MNYEKYPMITFNETMYDAREMETDRHLVSENPNFIYMLKMPVNITILREGLMGDFSLIRRISFPNQELLQLVMDHDICQFLFLNEGYISWDNLKWIITTIASELRKRVERQRYTSELLYTDVSSFEEMYQSISVWKNRTSKGLSNASLSDLVKITLHLFNVYGDRFNDAEYSKFIHDMVYANIPAIYQYIKLEAQTRSLSLLAVTKSPRMYDFIKDDKLRNEINTLMHEFYPDWDKVYSEAKSPVINDDDDSF